MLLGSAPVDWAVFRLARLPERRERLLARGGDAFALAEALRADPAEPGRARRAGAGSARRSPRTAAPTSAARRRGLASSAARGEAGAELEALDDAAWLDALRRPARERRAHGRARRPRRRCRRTTGPWAYDAGRRLALVTPAPARRSRPRARRRPPSAELVAAVAAAARA